MNTEMEIYNAYSVSEAEDAVHHSMVRFEAALERLGEKIELTRTNVERKTGPVLTGTFLALCAYTAFLAYKRWGWRGRAFHLRN